VRVWRPLAKKSTANQHKEYNAEKYIQWVATLSLTILVYLHSFSCCCVPNLRNPLKISSRSSKIIDLGVNQNRTCNFLLVINTRVDYCSSLLIGSPRSVTDKLQRVLNATARVITNTKKYETGLSRILHRDLHWLDVTERIQFRVAVTVYQCLHGMAPAYLTELCTPVTVSASRRGGLRSVTTSNLVVPRCKLSTYRVQCRWSSLLECLTGLFKVVRFVWCF